MLGRPQDPLGGRLPNQQAPVHPLSHWPSRCRWGQASGSLAGRPGALTYRPMLKVREDVCRLISFLAGFLRL